MNIHGRAHPGAAPAAPVRHRHDTRGLPRPRVVVAAWAAPAREPSPGCRTQWGDNGGIWGGMGTAAPRRGTARSGAPRSTAAPMGGRARPPPGFVFRPPPLGSGPQAARGNGVQKPLTPPPPFLFYFIILFHFSSHHTHGFPPPPRERAIGAFKFLGNPVLCLEGIRCPAPSLSRNPAPRSTAPQTRRGRQPPTPPPTSPPPPPPQLQEPLSPHLRHRGGGGNNNNKKIKIKARLSGSAPQTAGAGLPACYLACLSSVPLSCPRVAVSPSAPGGPVPARPAPSAAAPPLAARHWSAWCLLEQCRRYRGCCLCISRSLSPSLFPSLPPPTPPLLSL